MFALYVVSFSFFKFGDNARHFMQIAFLADLYDIPAELVVNSDQTGMPLVPASDFTRAPKGAKDVSTNGQGDKRQITVVPSTAANGESLPMQVIYQGKTSASLPPVEKRSGSKFAGTGLGLFFNKPVFRLNK